MPKAKLKSQRSSNRPAQRRLRVQRSVSRMERKLVRLADILRERAERYENGGMPSMGGELRDIRVQIVQAVEEIQAQCG